MGWLIMLGRGGSLSLQELCFQYVEAALLPNTLVSDVFLWVGSSCWEQVTDSLSFPHGILMVYHLISILSPSGSDGLPLVFKSFSLGI